MTIAKLLAREEPRDVASDHRLSDAMRWARSEHPDLVPIAEVLPGSRCTVAGIVDRVRIDPRHRRIQAMIFDGTGHLSATWPSEKRPQILPGTAVALRGRARSTNAREMWDPWVRVMPEPLEPADGSAHDRWR